MSHLPRRVLLLVVLVVLAPGLVLAPGHARAEEPLTLEQSIAIGLQRAPLVGVELERLREAEADYLVARAALFPRLSASAYYERLGGDRLTGSASPVYDREAFAGVRLTHIVFDGFGSWATRRAARHGIEAQRVEIEAARADVVYLVTAAFARVIETEELVKVAEGALARQQAFEGLADAQLRLGRGTRLDVLRASSQRVEAERSLVAAREAHALAVVLLGKVMGLDPRAPVSVTGSLPAAVEPPPTEAALLEAALAGNPELRKIGPLTEQAAAGVSAARGAYYPALSIQASAGYRDRGDLGSGTDWVGGVFLEWPFFEGGLRRGQVAKAEARARGVRESARALTLEVEAEVRDALAAWRVALASVASADKQLEANREAALAASAVYEAGRASALDVLTAEAELTRAEAGRIQALGEYAVARARVRRVTGATD